MEFHCMGLELLYEIQSTHMNDISQDFKVDDILT